MIKAEDLRIGDLVRVNCNCALAEGTIGTIVEISKGTNTNDKKEFVKLIPINGVSNWGWGVSCDNIEGIQFTLEILKKNGWKDIASKSILWVYYCKEKCSINVGHYDKSEKPFRAILGRMVLKNIKYVHELQHILWALGKDANLTI